MKRLILLYTLLFIFASCQQPVIDDIIETIPEIVPEIIIIEEKKEMEMKPIAEFAAYAVTDQKKVYGLSGAVKTMIPLEDTEGNEYQFTDFFKIGDTVYFSHTVTDAEAESTTHYYKQSAGKITVITKAKYPDKPESIFKTMAEGFFQIFDHEYEGTVYSRVMKHTEVTAFKQIDGYFYTPDGLWFSVPETISIRLKGVYFYDNKDNLTQFPDIVGRVYN